MNRLFRFKIVFLISLFLIFSQNAFSKDNTPKPYEKDEFPTIFQDLRRAEIITLGSMPFITLNVSLMYSFGKYAFHGFDSDYFTNPFSTAADSSSYTQDEQIGIILSSLGISLCVGVTDFIVHSIRNSKLRKQKNRSSKVIDGIRITPIKDLNKKSSMQKTSETEQNGDFNE